jgi:hypothetical protein
MTPRDDDFSSTVLDSKWTWFSGGTGSTYSLTDWLGSLSIYANNPTEFGTAPTQNLNNIPYIIENNINDNYAVEVNITKFIADGTIGGHIAGILIKKDNNNFAVLVKKYCGSGNPSKVSLYECIAGTMTLILPEAVFADDTNILLRLEWKDGQLTCFYRSSENPNWIEL